MTRSISRRGLGLAAGGILAAPAVARAQAGWPERPIRWIVPFPPAGTADIFSRMLAEHIGRRFGQPVSVENRAGAGGTLAANLLVQGRGDQHLVMISNFGPHGASPTLFPSVTYDAQADFTHVGFLGALPMVLAAHPSFPANDAATLLQMARAQGTDFTMGFGGTGTASHLIGLAMHRAAGINPTFVPYRGSGPLLNDVMGNTVPTMIDTLSAAIGHIRAERIKALAVSSPERSAALPDVPTFAELGLEAATAMNWFGLAMPAGMPGWLVERWAEALRETLALPDIQERLAQLGVVGTNIDPVFMTEHVGREVERWRAVIRENNVTVG